MRKRAENADPTEIGQFLNDHGEQLGEFLKLNSVKHTLTNLRTNATVQGEARHAGGDVYDPNNYAFVNDN